MAEPNTFGSHVRGQIEAAKGYLVAHGLHDVQEHATQPKAFDRHLHTIVARSGRGPCFLRLHYSWLEEHDPAAVRAWLEDKQLAESLMRDPDTDDITVTASGNLEY